MTMCLQFVLFNACAVIAAVGLNMFPQELSSDEVHNGSADYHIRENQHEVPRSPTVIDFENRGRCYGLNSETYAPNNTKWYTWWMNGEQRCTSVFIPPEASKPMPVIMDMQGEDIVAEAFGRFPLAHFVLSTVKIDSSGIGAWRFGNDGVVNDNKPQPCQPEDSPDLEYFMKVFELIEEDPSTYDLGKIYVVGISQSAMFAAYAGFCFSHKVAGVSQSISGLVVPSLSNQSRMPGLQGYCKASDYDTLGNSCKEIAPCEDCQYWPIYPCYDARPVVLCNFDNADDYLVGTQMPMYDISSAEGFDTRMFLFPDGGHKEPHVYEEWYVGCLGATESCSTQCATDFATCMRGQNTAFHADAYLLCTASETFPPTCTVGCSPTQDMLYLIEQPSSVSLSEGRFGAPAETYKTRPASSKCEHTER